MPYVELHARSAFSFLRSASAPEQLAARAKHLGHESLALCDRDGLYGAPRFAVAAREEGLRPIFGCELSMEDGTVLPVLVENAKGYRNLCRLLSEGHLGAPKGQTRFEWRALAAFSEGLVALTGDQEGPLWRALSPAESRSSQNTPDKVLQRLLGIFGPGHLYVELQRHRLRGENRVLREMTALARQFQLPLLATNGVLHARRSGRPLLDVLTCLREHTHLDAAGLRLSANGERHLKSAAAMETLFADLPEAVANTQPLAERLQFSLQNLGYEFPSHDSPGDAAEFLKKATLEGARRRYGAGIPRKVLRQLSHELALIGKLGFEGYFLIVWDIVNFCREKGILVQGRGSAANSAVCYCLGITAVDAVECNLLFERFLSEGRRSWPDIDLDLPSGARREEVIQEIYRRYGRHGAAMTANVITYRGRSAARELAKVLNFPGELSRRFSALFASGDFPHTLPVNAQLQAAGIPPEHPRTPAFLELYKAIHGLPRHLGQHSGGMIICKDKLSSIVPLENAAMPGRSVAQWDKEDCENLGIIKVDLLGLGMMSVLQDTVALCAHRGAPVDLAQIPKDDPATFDLMCAADTVGVFQIESRAQMATLPRMQPRCFYDVCIEVAIIRPGPIQGDLVHPYLARRTGKEPETYDDPRLVPILKRTLGVPLFQEQLLRIAMVMGDFTGSEAEELRRALSFHRSPERMAKVTMKLRQRMEAKGVPPAAIERVCKSVGSFALYGFPESHAISFAILAYASAWLKVHRSAEFYTCLLNNQPMGFYSSATLLADARRRGLRIRPVCVQQSQWQCTVDPAGAIRLGLCVVRGLAQTRIRELLEERDRAPFKSLQELKKRVAFNKDEWRVLASIGALKTLSEHRRDALWQIEATPLPEEDLFAYAARTARSCAAHEPSGNRADPTDQSDQSDLSQNPQNPLPPMTAGERLQADYRGTGLTTGPHPMALIRPRLPDIWRAGDLAEVRDGERVRVAGGVICRQRPGTAKGFVFLSLEDETGVTNAVIPPGLFEKHRLLLTQEGFLVVEGIAQKREGVLHIRAEHIEALTGNELCNAPSHDFH